MSLVFSTISNQIKISVEPEYRDQDSRSADQFYVWAYHVTIENLSEQPVQLLTRHWEVTDGNGLCQMINGDGVIGKQPIIAPQAMYQYSSWTTLATSSGIMGGNYGMVDNAGNGFEVRIPTFSLDSPEAIRMAN